MKIKEIQYLYISSVDISNSNGPAVNEREFITSLNKKVGKSAKYLIPRIIRAKVKDLPTSSFKYSYRCTRGDTLRFIPHTITQIYLFSNIIKEYKPDIIIFRLGLLPISQYIITKMIKVPYVVKTAGPSLLNSFKNIKFANILNIIQNKLVLYILNKAISIDCVSELHKSQLLSKINNRNVFVIDNAVNTERFNVYNKEEYKNQYGLSRYNKIIGYAGNYPYTRGGKQLLEIGRVLIKEKKMEDIALVILGEDPKIDELKKIARNYDIENNVFIKGLVPFEQIPKWINTFDLGISFLSPLQSGASEQKIRQYLACGKPVICSYGSSNFIFDKKLGFVENWDDIKGIIKSVECIINMNKEEYSELSKRCRSYAEKYLSVDNQTERRLQIWESML